MAHPRPLGRLVAALHDDRRQGRRPVSQRAFLRNLARGEAYLQEAPTLWDVTFQTAVAQAELKAREYAGALPPGRLPPPRRRRPSTIETTRPELIASVVALIAHPDDERYQALFGTTVTSPVFGVEIPVVAHPLAEIDKGAGIAMCCTFGDLTDVTWWRELRPPGPHRDRPRRPAAPARRRSGSTGEPAAAAYAELAGKTTFSAREAMVALLRETGDLDGEPDARRSGWRTSTRSGDKPLEIVATRQWYIRNGGRDAGPARRAASSAAAEIQWLPAHMRTATTTGSAASTATG